MQIRRLIILGKNLELVDYFMSENRHNNAQLRLRNI